MQHIKVQVDMLYSPQVCWSVLESTIRPPTKCKDINFVTFTDVNRIIGTHAFLSVKQDDVEINPTILAIKIIPSAF